MDVKRDAKRFIYGKGRAKSSTCTREGREESRDRSMERFFSPPSKVKSSKLQGSWLEGGHERFYDTVNWRLGIKYV